MTPSDGQLLTWDSVTSKWNAEDAPISLPDQTTHSGKYLTTNGTSASWDALATVANSGAYSDLSGTPTNVSTFTNDSGYLTGNQTITLSGDVSGSGTTSLVVTVADDSHNHIISNVDGLQVALDAKQAAATALTTSTTFSGDVSGTYNAIVVADDSHNHVISNVDGLQTALDGKSSTSHNHTLDGLSNTTITSNTAGEVLKWNGTAWVNNTLAEAGIQPAGSYLTGNQTITLSGDATGSGTTSIAVTVANDSHTHDTRYYTETEVGNFFSGASAITGYNKSNWDTAYGWGNHASAGYQAAATALTTSTSFGGDVSGAYNAIVVANDSHTHDTRYYTESEIDSMLASIGGGLEGAYASVFTASGTWNKPTGVNVVGIQVIGGGGAGGENNSNSIQGGGGGAGGAWAFYAAANLSNSYTVTVGAGGQNTSASGGASSFGNIVVGNGGGGGPNNPNGGGTGGSGGNGAVNQNTGLLASGTGTGGQGAAFQNYGNIANGCGGSGGETAHQYGNRGGIGPFFTAEYPQTLGWAGSRTNLPQHATTWGSGGYGRYSKDGGPGAVVVISYK